MSALFADPHWAYVWPAYALTLVCFAALAGWSVTRLLKWSRAANALKDAA